MREQGGFDFSSQPVNPTEVSPTGERLPPVSGNSPQARHASYTGALSAFQRWGLKQLAYLEALKTEGPLTDQAAAALLRWPLSSVNSIRNSLGDRIVPDGFDAQHCGSRQTKRTRWKVK